MSDKEKQQEEKIQVNVELVGEMAQAFIHYMKEQGLRTKASAGHKLFADGLRRPTRTRNKVLHLS